MNMSQNFLPVQAIANDKEITLRFNQGLTSNDLQLFADRMQDMFNEMQAKISVDNRVTQQQIADVKQSIKHKYITPEDLAALESLVDKKARKYVDKTGGTQLTIDVVLNYDSDDLKDMQRLIRKQYGKVKQRIWIELNKVCLQRKGTAPKNRIRDTQTEKAFDFVRTWGGFNA